MQSLDEVFGPRGPLARTLPGFTPRRSQLAMASRVALALENRAPLVVEAGTGTGKTFAYLVPALLSGKRVLISTGTRTLQDQLFNKDLPLVAGAIGVPARVALLKGRSNYLCTYRLKQLGGQKSLAGTRDRTLARVERWAGITKTGDLAEVPDLGDAHPLWPQITSTRENCLGARCADIGRCHVVEARRKAIEADIVIVNHHLLLADLALKEDGFGDLLGAADAVILDEAHQIPDLATQFFGTRFGSRQVELLLRDARQELAQARAPRHDAGRRARRRREGAGGARGNPARHAAARLARRGHAAGRCRAGTVARRCATLAAALNEHSREPASRSAPARATELAARLDAVVHAEENEGARSVELTQRGFTLSLLPFDIAARFAAMAGGTRAAWVFTSATLSVGEDFAHFTSRLGLDRSRDARHRRVRSISRSQALLYLPRAAAGSGVAGAHRARWSTWRCRSSRRPPAARSCCSPATARCSARRSSCATAGPSSANFRCWCRARRRANSCCARFRESGNAVLLGTASFWEGVDVKGDALRLVIIEKLPFSSPDDALTKARIEHLKANGRQCLPRIPAARGGAGAQAGCRPTDSQRDGSRRGGHLRSAARRQTLRPRVSRQPAAHAGHARRRRRRKIPAAHRRRRDRAAALPRDARADR